MSEVRYERDGRSGIVTLTIDTAGPVNAIGAAFVGELFAAVGRAVGEQATGMLLVSGKPKSFLDGANLLEIRKNASAFEDPALYSSIIRWNSSRKSIRVRFSLTICASLTAILARSF